MNGKKVKLTLEITDIEGICERSKRRIAILESLDHNPCTPPWCGINKNHNERNKG